MINRFFMLLLLFNSVLITAQNEAIPFYSSIEQTDTEDNEDNWKAFYVQASPLGSSDFSIFRPDVPIDDIVSFRDNLGIGYAYELSLGFYFNSFMGVGFSYSNASLSDQFNRFGELFYKNELNINTYSININNLGTGLREQDLFYFSYGVSYFDLQQDFFQLAGNYQRRASGNGFGFRSEIGYNYHLYDQLFLNLSSTFVIGSITSIRSYTPSGSYRLNELDEDTTSLLQLNFLVGLTYYLPF
ncbi:MAG: hypothetical protein LAT51_03025 [Flavobacteriaceae bacterium]|nr:hypothetical protein [Flavobacteriaceae bacterium]